VAVAAGVSMPFAAFTPTISCQTLTHTAEIYGG